MEIRVLYNKVRAARYRGDMLAIAIHESILDSGRDSSIGQTTDGLRPGDAVIVVGMVALLQIGESHDGPVIFFNHDETFLESFDWKGQVDRRLGQNPHAHIDWVMDYSPTNDQSIVDAGYRRVYCPIGYHQSFEVPCIHDVYDVGFIGTTGHRSRRKRMLGEIPKSIDLFVHQKEQQSTRAGDNPGDGLNSRIMLHVHRLDESQNFPATRVVQLAMSNRIPVLMEETSWMPPGMEVGVHLRTFPVGDTRCMVGEIREMLENEDETTEIGVQGYEFVSRCWPMTYHVDRALTEIGL